MKIITIMAIALSMGSIGSAKAGGVGPSIPTSPCPNGMSLIFSPVTGTPKCIGVPTASAGPTPSAGSSACDRCGPAFGSAASAGPGPSTTSGPFVAGSNISAQDYIPNDYNPSMSQSSTEGFITSNNGLATVAGNFAIGGGRWLHGVYVPGQAAQTEKGNKLTVERGVSPIAASVTQMYLALNGGAASYSWQSYLTQVAGMPAYGEEFIRNIAGSYADQHDDLFTLQVLNNLGFTPETMTSPGSYDAFRNTLQGSFTTYGVAGRGQIIQNLINNLVGLEDDATYGAIARQFNNQAYANYVYSTNPDSELPHVIYIDRVSK